MKKNVDVSSIVIDGKTYVPEDSITSMAKELKGMKYCIVRTYSAGVFAGYVESRDGQEVVILKSRRIWMWKGAATLSQLAIDGSTCPEECKFPCEVEKTELMQVIEIIECTEKAMKCIQGVSVWKT